MNSLAPGALGDFLLQRMQTANIRSKTLVFTFFCDVVTQHGGEIWLGNVIHAFAPLGINERLIRTAVFRLVQDGWLESRRQGRRSYYRLSDTGQNYYQRAARRIYASSKPHWDGVWTLIFVALVPEDKRESLHRGLAWLGYGLLATGVYALPCNDRPPLDELLADLELDHSIVCMQAHTENAKNLQKLVMTCWDLKSVRHRYEAFIAQYQKVPDLLRSSDTQEGHNLLLLRVLLVHEYRRILLSDPELPSAMLPPDWEGTIAQSLTGDIYRRLTIPTNNWAHHQLLSTSGQIKDGISTLRTRFPESSHNG